MDNLEEEEDVVMEGSELHQALVDMGYRDFELTPINKNGSAKENDCIKEPTRQRKYKWPKMLWHFSKGLFLFTGMFDNTLNGWYISMRQLVTILRMKSLLDDHAVVVQRIINKNSKSFWNQFTGWFGLVVSSAILGMSYLMSERNKTFSMSIGMLLVFLSMVHKYEEFQAIGALNDLVLVQNDLYCLYKNGLRVLRKGYRLRANEKKMQSKFSTLDIDRLKYLQPVVETLLQNMENVSRTYYYQASSMIVKLLPKKALPINTLTHLESDGFVIEGEVTYEKLQHLYYVYILVQSDMMQLLAIAYDVDMRSVIWGGGERSSHSLLTQIIVNLHSSLMDYKNQLVPIFMKYKSCTTKAIQRKFCVTANSKCRDLYLNLDLLSRKVQMAYDTIGLVFNEMDKYEDDEATEDDFVTELAAKTQDICAQIDKAKHFAEFNNLLVAIIQRSRHSVDSSVSELVEYASEVEGNGSTVRDSEQQITDEVFEEYITEEYMKPLYEESDETSFDITRFDEGLVKTFMSELKDALVDKYKSMSIREATALRRKYHDTTGYSNCEENIENRKGRESHGPVPLPRAITRSRNMENILPNSITQRVTSLPPSPPPQPFPLSKMESCKSTERFSIDLLKLGEKTMPAFITCVEEFIGSGENSEEDLENSDNEDDASFENV